MKAISGRTMISMFSVESYYEVMSNNKMVDTLDISLFAMRIDS